MVIWSEMPLIVSKFDFYANKTRINKGYRAGNQGQKP